MGSPDRSLTKPGKQHRRPRFSSTHNVKHLTNNGLSAGCPPHPYRPCRPPRLREARGISPSPFSRQPPFPNFFQRSADRRKTRKKSRQIFLGPISGPAKRPSGRREEAIYAPPSRHARGFWSKMQKLRVFHRTTSRAARTVENCPDAHGSTGFGAASGAGFGVLRAPFAVWRNALPQRHWPHTIAPLKRRRTATRRTVKIRAGYKTGSH